MSRHHQSRRRQSTPSTIIQVTDRDSDPTTPSKQTEQREKSCLTWINLALGALIPLAIGIGTVVITVQQQKNEDRRFQQTQEIEDRRFQQAQDNEDRRRNQDQYIANWTREQDQQQADNLHYQNVYSHFIIDISNSIFRQQNQTTTFVDNRTRLDYIRSQTLVTLADLDCRRKTWLFEFLHENELLPSVLQSTSMNLQGANFSCITLKSTNSKRFVFDGLVLPSVDLSDASFIECYFSDGFDFSGSSMEHIKFTQSFFLCINGNTLFERAMLSHANFYGTYLCKVSFTGADLSYANFTAAAFQGTIDLTGTDLTLTTFKDVVVIGEFLMIITNANMTGASILDYEWFNRAMYEDQIEMMDVILPNGVWMLNGSTTSIRNGNAEKDCTSLVIPEWDKFTQSNTISPTLSEIDPNESMNSSLGSFCFNFTLTTNVTRIYMAQRISFDGISKFIQSSEAEYHLSFDAKCHGGVIEIHLYFFTYGFKTPLQSAFSVNGTAQLHWEKRTISEKIPMDAKFVDVYVRRVGHTGVCYVDNIELNVRRGESKK